ncbi:MAG: type II toxin-antitoxin system Phd/YefM family antitoxin [Gammaproteobacteria bacterium]
MATSHDTITATELARNLAETIDRVRASGRGLPITRGGREVAQLVPARPQGASAGVIAGLLAHNPLTPAERADLADDLDAMRADAKFPGDPWAS